MLAGEALLVPIFKKGDKHQAANYRPVSLISITCKLIENIIHSSVMKHFDQHKVLCCNQHGFRKKFSCETQLLSTVQEIASSTAKGKQVDIIFLDLAKVFDKVPHSRLLYKLDYYGVRGNTRKWIEFFSQPQKPASYLRWSEVRHSWGHIRCPTGDCAGSTSVPILQKRPTRVDFILWYQSVSDDIMLFKVI